MATTKRTFTPGVIVRMLFFIVVVPFLPLLISGNWGWWQAWVFGVVCVLGFAVSRVLAARKNPDLLAERSRFMSQEDTKRWDRVLAPLVGLGGNLVPLVAGLEERWAPANAYGAAGSAVGLVLILAGYVLSSYALIENRFFSGVVRIQTERGHHVVTGGPYRWLRHPGYAGGIVAYAGMPLLLDSPWSILPTLVLVIALLVRTSLEDRTLQEELPGYKEYAQKVRYRLLPGIW